MGQDDRTPQSEQLRGNAPAVQRRRQGRPIPRLRHSRQSLPSCLQRQLQHAAMLREACNDAQGIRQRSLAMNAVRITPIAKSWQAFKAATGLCHIADERQYDDVIALMDRLIEEGAMEDDHPLNDLFLLAADLAYAYEQRAHPLPPVSGAAMLRFLMEQHGLRQSDLVEEIGSQGV